MTIKRVIIGFALAPLPIFAPFFLMFALEGAPLDGVPLFLLLVYCATLVVGLPVHLGLTMARRQDLLDYLAATAIAILALAGSMTVYSRWIFKPEAHGDPFALPLLWAQCGPNMVWVTMASLVVAGIGAAVFWLIAVRPRAQQVDAVTPVTA